MEKVFSLFEGLLPFFVYLVIGIVIRAKYGREADRDVLSLSFYVSVAYLTSVLVSCFGRITNASAMYDYTVLKLYFLSSCAPVLFLRKVLFKDRKGLLTLMSILAVMVLVVTDVLAFFGFTIISYNYISRMIVLVSVAVFLFISYAIYKHSGGEGKTAFIYCALMAVCNFIYIFYTNDINGLWDYIITALFFALIHVGMSFLALRPDAHKSYFEIHRREEQHSILEDDGVETLGSGGVYSNPNRPLKDRILDYFETEKPFLSKDLSMEEVAMHLFTNKSYLSKTINMEMNKNFRELVNSFRVREAIRLFSEDHGISINELRDRCGFNNSASFTSAFKLNTGCTPGEWCRNIKNQEAGRPTGR